MTAGSAPTADAHPDRWQLELYVMGADAVSERAREALVRICEEFLPGLHAIEVFDMRVHGDRADELDIVAAPTLIRRSPLPERRVVGDLSVRERVLAGLGLAPAG